MAASTVWAYAHEATVTMTGIEFVENFAVQEKGDRVEFSNLNSPRDAGGRIQYEGGVGMVTTDAKMDVFVAHTDTTIVQTGAKITGVIATFPDGRYLSGSFVIEGQDYKGATKGAYMYSITGFYTGDILRVAP